MNILQYPDPSLCEIADPVTDFGKEFLEQMAEVYQTMINLPQGSVAGLAAPQVGIRKRFFFAQGMLFVNPTIKLSKGPREHGWEGCFSDPAGPSKLYRVWRAPTVWIRYQDFKGGWYEEKFNGFMARVIQHEFSHLNGVMCSDQSAQDYTDQGAYLKPAASHL